MPRTHSPPDQVDKEDLYGRYQSSSDARSDVNVDRLKWQNKLAKQVAHKALDEPLLDDDEMNVNVNKTGMGWKELAIIGGMVTGTGSISAVATYLVMDRPEEPASIVQPQEQSEPVVNATEQYRPILRPGKPQVSP